MFWRHQSWTAAHCVALFFRWAVCLVTPHQIWYDLMGAIVRKDRSCSEAHSCLARAHQLTVFIFKIKQLLMPHSPHSKEVEIVTPRTAPLNHAILQSPDTYFCRLLRIIPSLYVCVLLFEVIRVVTVGSWGVVEEYSWCCNIITYLCPLFLFRLSP